MKMDTRMKWMCLFLLIGLHWGQAKKKVAIINYTSNIEVCDDPSSRSYIDTSGLKPVRINETTTKLEGGLSYKKGVDALVKVKVMIERLMPTGSKEVIFTHIVKDLCSEIAKRDEDTLIAPYLRTMNVPNCPIPPGDYRIENMVVDMRQIPKEAVIVGVYSLSFTFYSYEVVGKGMFAGSKDTRLACLSFECTVENV